MPWTVREDEDAMPLTDLLRTGEASRLRRRGAMRGGHRRDESEELAIRRVGDQGVDERRGEENHLELSCGVRISQFTRVPSTSSRPSPLPQSQSPSTSDSGFAYASTGCGALVNSQASPQQPGCIANYQVYTSRDLSNPDVVCLSSKYLDPEQRSVVDFLVNEDCGCPCDWQAIGCSICGNALGILFIPCHSRHSLDQSRTYLRPIHIFFPSSVTPSPSYTFPPIDHTLYRSMPPLVALSASDSDEMSIDSPTFSPRVQMLPNGEAVESQPFRLEGGDFDGANIGWGTNWGPNTGWGTDWDPPLIPTAPASPTTPTPLALAPDAWTGPELDGSSSLRPPDRRSSAPMSVRIADTRRQASARLRSRHQEPILPGPRTDQDMPSDDDDWGSFLLESDRASSARRHLNRRASTGSRNPLHPWIPRNQRERAATALPLSERPVDLSDDRQSREWGTGPVIPARTPEPPALHRVPRRHLSAVASPPRWPSGSYDLPAWRNLFRPPRPAHVSEGQEHQREGERAFNASRWTVPTSSVRHSRRLTAPGPIPPAFTLVDSAGERSYPPSARSSFEARDSLNVDPEVNPFRMPSRHFTAGDALVEGLQVDRQPGEPWMDRYAFHTEEPEEEDEDKADEERRVPDLGDRRASNDTPERSVDTDQESTSASRLRRDTS